MEEGLVGRGQQAGVHLGRVDEVRARRVVAGLRHGGRRSFVVGGSREASKLVVGDAGERLDLGIDPRPLVDVAPRGDLET